MKMSQDDKTPFCMLQYKVFIFKAEINNSFPLYLDILNLKTGKNLVQKYFKLTIFHYRIPLKK